MKILITSTATMIHVGNVETRLWRGVTDQGTPCAVLVHRIAVPVGMEVAFEAELLNRPPPQNAEAVNEVLDREMA